MGHRLHRPQSSQARTQADSVRGVAVGRWRGLNKAGGVTNQVTPHPIHHRAWPMSIRHDNLDRLLDTSKREAATQSRSKYDFYSGSDPIAAPRKSAGSGHELSPLLESGQIAFSRRLRLISLLAHRARQR